jgi:hypothetical protein
MTGRPRLGEWLAGASGALVLGSLLLPWYREEMACIEVVGARCRGRALGAGDAFAALDLVLVGVAVLGLGLPLLAATQRAATLPLAAAVLATLAGLAGLLLVAVRSLAFLREESLPLVPAAGLVAGLLALLGTAVGGILSIRDEGFGVRPASDTRPRPATDEELARIPKLPAPPKSG